MTSGSNPAPRRTPAPIAGPGVDITGQPEVPTAALPDPGAATKHPKTVIEKINAETEKPGQIEKYLALVGDAVAPSTMFAELTVSPAMNASMVIEAFTGNLIGPGVALVDVADAIRRAAVEVRDGDLSSLESMLVSQAHALSVMFTSLSIRGQKQTGQRNIDSFLGLALRAQAQGVATIAALVALRQGPLAGEGGARPSRPAASRSKRSPGRSKRTATSSTRARTGRIVPGSRSQ